MSRAAEYLGVSTMTVRRMVARGELVAYRIGESSKGKLIRVDLNQIDTDLLRPIPTTPGIGA